MRRTLGLVIFMAVVLSIAGRSFAEKQKSADPLSPKSTQRPVTLTSQEIIRKTKYWDGRRVIFKGEAIGDLMPRGDYVWLNVQDDFGTIAIWAPQKMVQMVEYIGDYKNRGDTLEIEGQFFRADPKKGGESYVLAQRIKLIDRGYPTTHTLSPLKIEVTVLLLMAAVVLGFLRFRIKPKTE